MVETNSTEKNGWTATGLITKKNIAIVIGVVIVFYWILFVLTPFLNSSSKTKEEIQSMNLMLNTLDNYIKEKEQEQNNLDNSIQLVNEHIEKIDSAISKIKVQKVIIREYYHEKINNVDGYDDSDIDSFITNRYGK
jgi:hypothetical protein